MLSAQERSPLTDWSLAEPRPTSNKRSSNENPIQLVLDGCLRGGSVGNSRLACACQIQVRRAPTVAGGRRAWLDRCYLCQAVAQECDFLSFLAIGDSSSA